MPAAAPGTYYLVFSKQGREFKMPYKIAPRREGSAERGSFTTADMIYLVMPDRFANGNPDNDSTPDTQEKADREAFFGRHGGDIRGIRDTWTTLPTSGQRSSGPRPCCSTTNPKDRTTAMPAPTTTASTHASVERGVPRPGCRSPWKRG